MYPTKEELLKKIQYYNGLYSLEKYGVKRELYSISKENTEFFFRQNEDFNFWVKEYYMKYADEVKIINNILKEDNTINYKVTYNINRINEIFNMHTLNNYNNYISIKNHSLQDILAIASESQMLKNSILHNIDVTPQKNIFKELVKELQLTPKKTVKKLYDLYLKENETYNKLNDIICWDYRMNCFEDSMEAIKIAYNTRDEILRKILGLPQNVKLKNTSELTLYKIVRDVFKDAIYQYRTEWLGRQSIDIFIPKIKVGIEYQGEQHYKPIDIYGGKSQFKKQVGLDHKKKKICEENNVKLLYWKYDKIINKENVTEMLKTLT